MDNPFEEFARKFVGDPPAAWRQQESPVEQHFTANRRCLPRANPGTGLVWQFNFCKFSAIANPLWAVDEPVEVYDLVEGIEYATERLGYGPSMDPTPYIRVQQHERQTPTTEAWKWHVWYHSDEVVHVWIPSTVAFLVLFTSLLRDRPAWVGNSCSARTE